MGCDQRLEGRLPERLHADGLLRGAHRVRPGAPGAGRLGQRLQRTKPQLAQLRLTPLHPQAGPSGQEPPRPDRRRGSCGVSSGIGVPGGERADRPRQVLLGVLDVDDHVVGQPDLIGAEGAGDNRRTDPRADERRPHLGRVATKHLLPGSRELVFPPQDLGQLVLGNRAVPLADQVGPEQPAGAPQRRQIDRGPVDLHPHLAGQGDSHGHAGQRRTAPRCSASTRFLPAVRRLRVDRHR
jgi:hypothetical protein